MTKRSVRIFLACVAGLIVLFATWTVSWVLILQHRLNKIVNLPGVGIVPEPYRVVTVSKTRSVNVGSATFALPISVQGEPVRDRDSVIIAADHPTSGKITQYIMVGEALRDESKPIAPMLANYSRTFGGMAETRFELEMAVLNAQPFSAWSIFAIGRREAVRRALLLSLKAVEAGPATSIGIGRSTQIGFFVIIRPEMTRLFIEDLTHHTSQEFSISPDRPDAREIISAIVASYETH